MEKGRLASLSVTILTSLISWAVFYFLFGLFLNQRGSIFLATFFIATVITHEVFHVVALRRHGIRAHAYMAIIAGQATGSQDDEFDRLAFHKKAEVFLSGMMGNMLVAVIFAALHIFGPVNTVELIFAFLFTGLLITRNLITHSNTDGHRLVSLIVLSDENHEKSLEKISILTFSVFILTAFTLVFYQKFLFLFCVSVAMMFVFLSFWKTSNLNHKPATPNPIKLTENQKGFWIKSYVGTLAASMCLIIAGALLEKGSLINALGQLI